MSLVIQMYVIGGRAGRTGLAGASAAEAVEVHFLWRPQLSDPADEPVLEAAVNGQAAILVTYSVREPRSRATWRATCAKRRGCPRRPVTSCSACWNRMMELGA